MPADTSATRARLLPCPFCGRLPHHGKTKKQYCQLHGEPYQRYAVYCPDRHSYIEQADRQDAERVWNTRAPITETTQEGSDAG